jgi:hypothetical protein
MFSTWKWNSTSSTQVIKGIDDVLDAILDPQTVKMELLAHEERSSFMNEYSRYRTYIVPSYTSPLTA